MAEIFQLPMPPQGTIYPEVAQSVASVAIAVLTAAFLVYAFWDWRRTRSPLVLLMLLGGAVSYLNEPIMDVLGLVWHPRPGQIEAFTTYGPVPVWGIGVYVILFGGMPAVMLRQAQAGLTARAFWTGVVAFMLFDIAVEWPATSVGLYSYYGEAPFKILGLPLYWLFINPHGPLISVALLLFAPQLFRGWRQLLIVLLPMSTYAAGSMAVAWPVFSALNVPDAPMWLKTLGALLTFGLGSLLYYEMSKLICRAPLTRRNSRFAEGAVAST